jgi:hypothetical protein
MAMISLIPAHRYASAKTKRWAIYILHPAHCLKCSTPARYNPSGLKHGGFTATFFVVAPVFLKISPGLS